MLKGIRQETVVKPGGVIELISSDLPVGTSVEVTVLIKEEGHASDELSEDERWARFDSVIGVWKDDEDIDQIFKEIEQDRHRGSNREMPSFDD